MRNQKANSTTKPFMVEFKTEKQYSAFQNLRTAFAYLDRDELMERKATAFMIGIYAIIGRGLMATSTKQHLEDIAHEALEQASIIDDLYHMCDQGEDE